MDPQASVSLFNQLTALGEEASDLPSISVAARFNTFLTAPNGLGLNEDEARSTHQSLPHQRRDGANSIGR